MGLKGPGLRCVDRSLDRSRMPNPKQERETGGILARCHAKVALNAVVGTPRWPLDAYSAGGCSYRDWSVRAHTTCTPQVKPVGPLHSLQSQHGQRSPCMADSVL